MLLVFCVKNRGDIDLDDWGKLLTHPNCIVYNDRNNAVFSVLHTRGLRVDRSGHEKTFE